MRKELLVFLMVMATYTLTGIFGWQLYNQPPKEVKSQIVIREVPKVIVKNLTPKQKQALAEAIARQYGQSLKINLGRQLARHRVNQESLSRWVDWHTKTFLNNNQSDWR